MTQEESNTFLARENLTGYDVDTALEEGLRCPGCGGRQFVTIQAEQVFMSFDGDAEPGSEWGDRRLIVDTGETISLSCGKCGGLLWGEAP